MTSYNQTRPLSHMTMASIANVTRYTDPEDYELILMSEDEKEPVRDDYKVLKIDKYIKTQGVEYAASMNMGAKEAKGDYLVFLQNDVFVWEGWLPNLRYYLETGFECVWPDQMPRSREFVKQAQLMAYDVAMKFGSRDAGLMMITREAFDKVGGWNDQLSILAEKDFYQRLGDHGIKMTDTCKVMISHIMGGSTNQNTERFHQRMDKDAKKLNI